MSSLRKQGGPTYRPCNGCPISGHRFSQRRGVRQARRENRRSIPSIRRAVRFMRNPVYSPRPLRSPRLCENQEQHSPCAQSRASLRLRNIRTQVLAEARSPPGAQRKSKECSLNPPSRAAHAKPDSFSAPPALPAPLREPGATLPLARKVALRYDCGISGHRFSQRRGVRQVRRENRRSILSIRRAVQPMRNPQHSPRPLRSPRLCENQQRYSPLRVKGSIHTMIC